MLGQRPRAYHLMPRNALAPVPDIGYLNLHVPQTVHEDPK